MNFGLYIDLTTIIKESNGNVWENIEQLLACIIKEKKQKGKKKKGNFFSKYRKSSNIEIMNYELEDYDFVERLKRAKEFLSGLNVKQAIGALSFF